MITLWGRINSVNVQKVVWALEETRLPYRRIDAGLEFGVTDTPAYRAMNPNGLVPVIEDEGFVLWESNAIVRYLAARAPEAGLLPVDLRARADADRWMDWAAGTLVPAMGDAFHGIVRTPGSRSPEAVAASVAATERFFSMLEARLADRPFLAGEAFTVADIPAGCAAHRWLNMPVERAPRPHLERWYAGLRERPASAPALLLPIV
jgi:glutathione S-transferase